MSKWLVVALLIFAVMAIGLWMTVDPNARAAVTETSNRARTLVVEAGIPVDGDSILASITEAFGNFADSVVNLWSPDTIRIELPSIQMPQ